jgi:hypothetical protein
MAKAKKQTVITLATESALEGDLVEIDREAGTISGISVITSGAVPSHGFFVDDVMLGQVAEQINEGRAGTGVKVRMGHPESFGRDAITTNLGRMNNARVEDGKVRADFAFGSYAASMPGGDPRAFLFDLAEEAPDLIGLSIAFIPDLFEERHDDDGLAVAPAARSKEMLAVDFVDEPAANPEGLLSKDTTNQESDIMATKKKAAEAVENVEPVELKEAKIEAQPVEVVEAVELEADSTPETVEAADEAELLSAEHTRVDEITKLGKLTGLGAEFALGHINKKSSLLDVTNDALAKLAKENQPVNITGGEDLNVSSLSDAISDAVLLRSGCKLLEINEDGPRPELELDSAGKPQKRAAHERSRDFRSLSLVDMGRQWLNHIGLTDAYKLSRTRVTELMSPYRLRQAYPAINLAASTSDFSSILENSINKSLRQAYLEAPTTWQAWCRRGTAPDFKTISRTQLSDAPALLERAEGAEIKYLAHTDAKETYTLVEYARGLVLTRQAIVNDDLDAFNRIPSSQALAAARKEDDVAYAILTGNAAMSDAVALFHDTHVNLMDTTGSVGSPTVAKLAATEQLLLDQTGPSGAQLETRARFLLVPTVYFRTAQQVVKSAVDPAKSNATMNPFANETLDVIPSKRLGTASATQWYLVGDPNVIDTVEVSFLEDEQMPVLNREEVFDTNDMKFSVRHTVAAKALDWRGMVRNGA